MLFIAYASLISRSQHAFSCCGGMSGSMMRSLTVCKTGYILLTAGMLIGYPWLIGPGRTAHVVGSQDKRLNNDVGSLQRLLHARIYVYRENCGEHSSPWRALLCNACIYLSSHQYCAGIHSVVRHETKEIIIISLIRQRSSF